MKTTSKTLIIFSILFYLAWIIRRTVLYNAVELSLTDETSRLIFADVIKFLIWVVPAVAYVIWLERANPLTFMKIITPIDKHGLAVGSLVSLAYFVVIFVSERLKTGQTLDALFQASAGAWLIMLAQVAFSAFFEEIMFRGFMLPQFNNRMEFWKANALQAVFFTAMHWPQWLWINGLTPTGVLVASISVLAIGLLLGWLFKRTNSIWPPVVFHIVNNFLVSFLK